MVQKYLWSKSLTGFCLRIYSLIVDISFVNVIGQNMENKGKSSTGVSLRLLSRVRACERAWTRLTAWLPCTIIDFLLLIKHSSIPVFQMTELLVASQYRLWRRPPDAGNSPIGFCPGSDEDFTRKKCTIGMVGEGSLQSARHRRKGRSQAL